MIYAIASMMTDQEKKVEDMPFLVTTPKNYNVSSNKYLHWSEVRSHVATRQHALKRYQFSSSTYSSSHTLICSRAKPLNQETDIPSLSQPADSDPFKKPIHKPPNTIIPSSRHRYRGFPSARRGHQCHHKNADPFCSLHGALDNSRRRVPKITEIHSILDPFVRLPLNISAEEQNLMQFCEFVSRFVDLLYSYCRSSADWPTPAIRCWCGVCHLSGSWHCTSDYANLPELLTITHSHWWSVLEPHDSTSPAKIVLLSLEPDVPLDKRSTFR